MGGRHALQIGPSSVLGQEVVGVNVLVSWVVDFMLAGLGAPCGGGVSGFADWGWLAKEVCFSKESGMYAV